jgi:hypothetical protein
MAQRRRIDELRGYEPSGADPELPLRWRCSVLPARRASAARFGQSVRLSSHLPGDWGQAGRRDAPSTLAITWQDRAVSSWGRHAYGEPCRECGFSWSIDASDAKMLVAKLPARLTEVLGDADGGERHPDLAWSVSAYVLHVSDNLRIWAERVAGITLGGSGSVSSYDENALASARAYDSICLPSALWSLERAVRDWLDAVAMAPEELTMIHPERGEISVRDVIRSNAHDATHHLWDIERSLER